MRLIAFTITETDEVKGKSVKKTDNHVETFVTAVLPLGFPLEIVMLYGIFLILEYTFKIIVLLMSWAS